MSKNVIEVQAILHNWGDRFSENLKRVLGDNAAGRVIKGIENITPESTIEERGEWVISAISRLDEAANEEHKFQILSCCAHVFPEERIKKLKGIYNKTGDVDEVLGEMYKDEEWYSKPIREKNIIRKIKVPFDAKGYKAAKTAEEKRKNYCHCPLIRNYLGKVSPTFCYCGTGWSKQLWEGIIGKPVHIKILKSITKGDDYCEFEIHLPI